MYERRWGVIAGGVVAVILVGAIGWIIGRSGGPEASAKRGATGVGAAVRLVDDVPVGVQHSRAGALAAADNYVAVASETALQDPTRYATLVREAYVGSYQARAIREAQAARRRQSELISQYEAGRRGLALIAARRLDEYADDVALVTTWTAGVSWGPGRAAGQRWFFTETRLRWVDDRWRVASIDESERVAPTPGVVRYSDRSALTRELFERELEGMTAPSYGTESP